MIVLWEGSHRDQMRFAFLLLDFDHNGALNSNDLLFAQERVDPSSEYGREI